MGVLRIRTENGWAVLPCNVKMPMRNPYAAVNWLDTVYAVGENHNYAYNAWCPDTVAYDETRGKIVFMQVHSAAHGSAMKDKTLVTIDPYDPTVYEKVENFPAFVSGDGVGGLIVENGVWTAYGQKVRSRSTDGGQTWETVNIVTPPGRLYGVFKINGVLYCGDDALDTAHNGYYYVSYDDGLNWEQKVFDFADSYAIPCSEARFCEWKGTIYATLRREEDKGILARLANGVWEVVYDQLPNVSSDSSLLAFDDVIAISSVDRPNCKLILSTWDGETLAVNKEVDFTGLTASGDFHTPTYIHGNDWQAVFFMTYGMDGANEYWSAMNAALFGYKTGVEANAPTYEVETVAYTHEDFYAEPAYNCAPVVTESGIAVNAIDSNKTPFVNCSKQLTNSFPPDENGRVYYYGFTSKGGTVYHLPVNRYGLGNAYLGAKQVGDRTYVCVVRKGSPLVELPGVKIMGIANKITVEDSDMSGATYCVPVFPFAGAGAITGSGTAYRVKQD